MRHWYRLIYNNLFAFLVLVISVGVKKITIHICSRFFFLPKSCVIPIFASKSLFQLLYKAFFKIPLFYVMDVYTNLYTHTHTAIYFYMHKYSRTYITVLSWDCKRQRERKAHTHLTPYYIVISFYSIIFADPLCECWCECECVWV